MITQTEYVHRFDAKGALVATEESAVDVTAAVVELDVHVKARQAFAANRAYLAVPTPSAAQVAAQVKALTRQVNALLRLGPLRDLLADEVVD